MLEDLNTRGMTASARGTLAEPGRNVRQKAGLNRAILNAGWHQFATILAGKMEERGGQTVTVPARFTSQTCAACGVVDARSRESQARFVCVSCGHADHADINAALVIKQRANSALLDVEGLHQRPYEASTGRDLKVSENPRPFRAGKMLSPILHRVLHQKAERLNAPVPIFSDSATGGQAACSTPVYRPAICLIGTPLRSPSGDSSRDQASGVR